jgi:hypothetical protein
MRPEFSAFDVPVSVASGAPKIVDRHADHSFQVTGTFVATLHIEGSNDGVVWVPIFSGITAPSTTMLYKEATVKMMRVRVSAFTSGIPAVHWGGFDMRGS